MQGNSEARIEQAGGRAEPEQAEEGSEQEIWTEQHSEEHGCAEHRHFNAKRRGGCWWWRCGRKRR